MQSVKKEQKAVALVTVLIFVLLSSLIAGALIALISNESRLIESQIRRIRAVYAAEAGIQQAISVIRSGANPNDNSYPIGDLTAKITYTLGAGPGNTNTINSTTNYELSWW